MQDTDTAYAKHGSLNYTMDAPDEYRTKTYNDIRRYVDQYGMVSFIDKMNHMTEALYAERAKPNASVVNVDIFIEEVVSYLDQRYPATNLRHIRVHS